MDNVEKVICTIMITLVAVSIVLVVVGEYKRPYVRMCDRELGHGISYKEKELCILQEIANGVNKHD